MNITFYINTASPRKLDQQFMKSSSCMYIVYMSLKMEFKLQFKISSTIETKRKQSKNPELSNPVWQVKIALTIDFSGF